MREWHPHTYLIHTATMRQLFYLSFFPLTVVACGLGSKKCDLNGHWSTHEGQDLVFLPEGNALWLTQFGSHFDTTRFQYNMECACDGSVHIDFYNFRSGPHMGKTLYGLLERANDSTFRLRYEPGFQPEVRPAALDPEQTVQYMRIR